MTAHELSRELGFQLVSNQPQYSMLWRVIEDEVVPTSEELGVGQIVFARSPKACSPASTCRASRCRGVHGPPMRRAERTSSSGSCLTTCSTRVQALRPVADQAGITMAQLAVAWVLHNPNVASAIIGASRPEQVTENVRAAGVTLAPELIALVDEVLGDVVERDADLTLENAPAKRPV